VCAWPNRTDRLENLVKAATNVLSAAWTLIREFTKLFRLNGNTYGHTIGQRWQFWCRLTGRRDTMKGLRRLVGTRPDAGATNARRVLETKANGLDQFWTWLQQSKSSDEAADNKLVSSVKSGLSNASIVAGAWMIAVLSDGLFQPLMYAINERDYDKDMLSMRPIAMRLLQYLSDWSAGQGFAALFSGWLVGAGVGDQISEYTPHWHDAVCSAYDWLDDADRAALACACRRTAWAMGKRRRTDLTRLRELAERLRDTFVRFTAEYAPGGALHPPAKDASAVAKAQWTQTTKVANTCPNNDDPCERNVGKAKHIQTRVASNMLPHHKEARVLVSQNETIEWLCALPPEQFASVMSVARTYRSKMDMTRKQRAERDEQQLRASTKKQIEQNSKRRTKRTARQTAMAAVVLWTSETDMRTAVQSRSSETARKATVRQQLTALRHRLPDKTITLSAKGKPLTSAQLQELWLSVHQKHGAAAFDRINAAVPRAMDTDTPAAYTASPTATATTSSAATAAAASAPPPPQQSTDQAVSTTKVRRQRVSDFIKWLIDRLAVDVQTKKKRGRSTSARTSKEQNDKESEHDDTKPAAKRQRKSAATGGRARRADASAAAERALVCCSRPDELNEPCVQCDVCHEWMHCMCENVDWDVVQEMGQYVCCDCERDDIDRT
jgi:hypothetical protein